MAGPFQFQQETAAGHVFVLSLRALPVPQPAKFHREAGTVPVGIGSKQLLDLLDIYGYELLHAVEHNIKKCASPAKNEGMVKIFLRSVRSERNRTYILKTTLSKSNFHTGQYWDSDHLNENARNGR